MSMDSIDDLEAAEHLIGTLERALRDALNLATSDTPAAVRERGLAAMRAAITYCRPTCDMHGEQHPAELGVTPGYADSCGCPCHDRNPNQGATS
jgi:hypothetical protein